MHCDSAEYSEKCTMTVQKMAKSALCECKITKIPVYC